MRETPAYKYLTTLFIIQRIRDIFLFFHNPFGFKVLKNLMVHVVVGDRPLRLFLR